MSFEDLSDVVSKTLLICYILLSNSAFPISARPGEPDYNYGWTPPAGRVPYSPPWPGGAPLTAVDRAEAVAAEVGNEASAAAHSVEEPWSKASKNVHFIKSLKRDKKIKFPRN